MLLLSEFSVMNPSFGLLFWTSIIFILVWAVLGSFFKTIKSALKQRESDIQTALDQAAQARKELAQLAETQKNMEKQAAEDRSRIIAEANSLRDKILEESKFRAEETSKQILEAARVEINNRKKEMEVTLLNEVGKMAVDIAQNILNRELTSNHDDFVNHQLDELKKSKLN